MKVVQETLGHTSSAFTTDTYTSVYPQAATPRPRRPPPCCSARLRPGNSLAVAAGADGDALQGSPGLLEFRGGVCSQGAEAAYEAFDDAGVPKQRMAS